MVFNASAQSFLPLASLSNPFNPAALPPVVTEPSIYTGLTTAALTAIGLTSVSVATTATLIQSARVRNTMTLIVPTDQQAVTIGNNNTYQGTIQAAPANFLIQSPATQTFAPGVSGFAVAPGVSVQLAPYNDPLYGIVPVGTATVFYVTT